MSVTDTVNTTARQVRLLTSKRVQLVAMDETTLRVSTASSTRGKTYRNIDIAYVSGLDLYTVTVHTIDRKTYEHTSESFSHVYADQLGDFVDGRLG